MLTVSVSSNLDLHFKTENIHVAKCHFAAKSEGKASRGADSNMTPTCLAADKLVESSVASAWWEETTPLLSIPPTFNSSSY